MDWQEKSATLFAILEFGWICWAMGHSRGVHAAYRPMPEEDGELVLEDAEAMTG